MACQDNLFMRCKCMPCTMVPACMLVIDQCNAMYLVFEVTLNVLIKI